MLSVGAGMNLQFIIISCRINPALLATSLELCFCFGSIVASTAPKITSMSERAQLIAICSYCIFGITTVSNFKNNEIKKIDFEKSMLTIIEES